MTCRYVRSLIEALPIEEWHPQERRRVNRHADVCSNCKTALLKASALDSGLRRLPEAEAPAGLTQRVMARTAQVARSPAAFEESPFPTAGRTFRKAARFKALGWGAMYGGGAMAFGILLDTLSPGRWWTADWTPNTSVHWNGILKMPDPNAATLMLAIGLLLCVAGFFMALGKESN